MPTQHTPNTLKSQLKSLGIPFHAYQHKALFTVADGEDILHTFPPGAHIKNLFLKDKSGKLTLITALQERSLNLTALAKHLSAKDRFSFANEDILMNILGVSPGSVSPLALINAPAGHVQVVLDSDILAHPLVFAHPLCNTETLGLTPNHLLQAVQHWGHQPQWLNLGLFPKITT